jgi:hypothetical protein
VVNDSGSYHAQSNYRAQGTAPGGSSPIKNELRDPDLKRIEELRD